MLDRRRLRGRRCDQWILLVGTRAPPSHKVVRVDVGLGHRVLFSLSKNTSETREENRRHEP